MRLGVVAHSCDPSIWDTEAGPVSVIAAILLPPRGQSRAAVLLATRLPASGI